MGGLFRGADKMRCMEIHRSATTLTLEEATLLLLDINPQKKDPVKIEKVKRTKEYKLLFETLYQENRTAFGFIFSDLFTDSLHKVTRKTRIQARHLKAWGNRNGYICDYLENKPKKNPESKSRVTDFNDLKTTALLIHYISKKDEALRVNTTGKPNLSKIRDKLIQTAEELGINARGLKRADQRTLKRALEYLNSLKKTTENT